MSTQFPLPGLPTAGATPEDEGHGSKRRRRPTREQLLEGLNDPQREAVVHEGSPLLVVAGAGSGKTRVLTRRIAWLISERGAHPGSVLAITFTNKAAAEMRERVEELVGGRAKIMWVSTFHSACVRILRKEIDKFGFKSSFSIYDAADSKRLMTLVCRDLDLDVKRYPPRAILNWVSNAKNELQDHEDAAKDAANGQEETYAAAYGEYQRRLRQANALDFDDLLMMTVHLFRAFPAVRENWRRRFRHVLVDEYQDTNHAQYALIHELCADSLEQPVTEVPEDSVEPAELMVVGDADQSIYAFRGANIRNIMDFEQDFPNARTIMLEQNYRSTQTILTAANAVISRNESRKPKNLGPTLDRSQSSGLHRKEDALDRLPVRGLPHRDGLQRPALAHRRREEQVELEQVERHDGRRRIDRGDLGRRVACCGRAIEGPALPVDDAARSVRPSHEREARREEEVAVLELEDAGRAGRPSTARPSGSTTPRDGSPTQPRATRQSRPRRVDHSSVRSWRCPAIAGGARRRSTAASGSDRRRPPGARRPPAAASRAARRPARSASSVPPARRCPPARSFISGWRRFETSRYSSPPLAVRDHVDRRVHRAELGDRPALRLLAGTEVGQREVHDRRAGVGGEHAGAVAVGERTCGSANGSRTSRATRGRSRASSTRRRR